MYDITFLSEEEIIKRLQIVLQDFKAARGDYVRQSNSVKEVRDLAAKLAERIYDEPQKWGITEILPEFRDDATTDTFVSLLLDVENLPGRNTVSDWFERAIESKFRKLWSLAEDQASKSSGNLNVNNFLEDSVHSEPETNSGLIFEEHASLWESFESDFPRDAFALRLRFMLGRSVDQMVVMLDAPSIRAIAIRINRARDRLRMFCEQRGLDKTVVQEIMNRLPEEVE